MEKQKYWIARDEDNTLMLYNKKPIKDNALGIWKLPRYDEDNVNFDPALSFVRIQDSDLPIIGHNPQWTDTEPTEVELNFVVAYKEC